MASANRDPVVELQRDMRRFERMSDAAYRAGNASAAIANDGRAGAVSCQKDMVAPTTFRGAAVKLGDLAVPLSGNIGTFECEIDMSVWARRVLEIKPRVRAGRHTAADVLLLRRLARELREIETACPGSSAELDARLAEQAVAVLSRLRLVE